MEKTKRKSSKWFIQSRGFFGKIILLESVNTDEDTFFKAIILQGKKKYLSSNRYQESIGDTIFFRTSLTKFIKKIK